MKNLSIKFNGKEARNIDISYQANTIDEDIVIAKQIVEIIKQYPKIHCTLGKDDVGLSYFHIGSQTGDDIKKVYEKITELTFE